MGSIVSQSKYWIAINPDFELTVNAIANYTNFAEMLVYSQNKSLRIYLPGVGTAHLRRIAYYNKPGAAGTWDVFYNGYNHYERIISDHQTVASTVLVPVVSETYAKPQQNSPEQKSEPFKEFMKVSVIMTHIARKISTQQKLPLHSKNLNGLNFFF